MSDSPAPFSGSAGLDADTLLAALDAAVLIVDGAWRITFLNHDAEEYVRRLGFEPGALRGAILLDVVPSIRDTEYFAAAQRAVRERQAVDVEAFCHPLGRWLAAKLLPQADGLVCVARDSTSARAAEEAARTNAEMVQALVNGTGDAIYAKDLSGRYVMVNRAAAEQTGHDLLGRTDREAFPPATWAMLEANDKLVLARETPLVFEESVRRPDGTMVTFESSKTVYRDGEGRPAGILGISRDITQPRRERRRRQLLYDAGNRLTSTLDVDATLDVITSLVVPDFADYCAIDLLEGGEVQRARFAHADKLLDREIGPLVRQQAPQLEWFDHPIATALRTGEPVAVYEVGEREYRQFSHSDDHRVLFEALRPTSLVSVPLVAHDHVFGALTTGFTSSGRRYSPEDLPLLRALADRMALALANARLYRAAQDELRQRAQVETELTRWGRIFEHAGWGVAIEDASTQRLTQVNPAFARMHGFEPAELVGVPILRLTAPSHRDHAAAQSRHAQDAGRAVYRSRHRRRDGSEFPVLVDVVALHAEEGGGMLLAANVQDVSEQEQSEERVRQAQKMEALGRLAGGVAHDFNNMLMIIMGFADFLVAAMDEADQRRQDAVEIRAAAERAAALTQQLMAFGRRAPMRVASVNLNTVVGALSGMLRSVLGESIQLETRLDPVLGGVEADAGQLEQALLNLALNAKDAMPAGGALTITTRNLIISEGDHDETGAEVLPGHYVAVEVRDTGHGMDDTTRARIFEPFFSTRAGSRNSGLGLAVVYGIITQHRGGIMVESSPDTGTAFTLLFPRRASPVAPLAPGDDGAPAGHERVLVVEDEPAVRQLVTRALAAAGYEVLEASSAEAALGLLRRGPAPDALVADLVLPGMHGEELAARVAAEVPGLAVVLMTGHTEAQEPVHDGAMPLAKPFTPDRLVRRVREALDARPAASLTPRP